jgi:small subunit ribosomal protein S16
MRLKRMGNAHRPFYRLTVVDQRRQRDGRVIEELGYFNPIDPDESKQVNLKLERCAYWLSVGAQPSETATTLMRRAGLKVESGTKVSEQPTAQA